MSCYASGDCTCSRCGNPKQYTLDPPKPTKQEQLKRLAILKKNTLEWLADTKKDLERNKRSLKSYQKELKRISQEQKKLAKKK